MSIQGDEIRPYLGQLIADGIRNNFPLGGLEDKMTFNEFAAKTLQSGLTPKINYMKVASPMLFTNPLSEVINTVSAPFGAGVEVVDLMAGSINRGAITKCREPDIPKWTSQIAIENFAVNLTTSISEQDWGKGAIGLEQRTQLVTSAMLRPWMTRNEMEYRAWVQLLSNSVDGTRNVAGTTTRSDGEGNPVAYNPTIQGYAGAVIDVEFTIPEVARKQSITGITAENALDFVRDIEDAYADMRFPDDDYTKMGNRTFAGGGGFIVMEQKVYNAMNDAINRQSATVSTKSFTELIGGIDRVVLIDSFADLPTGAPENMRQVAVAFGGPALWDYSIVEANVWSDPCMEFRRIDYNLQESDALFIDKAVPSVAFFASTVPVQ